MALIKWGDSEDDKNKDPFAVPTVKPIQSVQEGAWQPTQDGVANDSSTTDGPQPQQQQAQPQLKDTNYIVSDQKAAIDEQKRQQDAAEAAAQAEAARQADIARANEANARAAAAQEAQVVSQPKYSGGNNAPKDEGILGFFKNIGAGIQQGIGALGDIAVQGGGVIGSLGKNDQQLVDYMNNVEKVRNWIHGQKDINGNNIVGTQDVTDAATRINNGTATPKDYFAIGGKGLQAGVDATMFINPARLATEASVRTAIPEATNLLSRFFTNPAVRFAGRDAAFFGGTQGAATAAQQYGENGNIPDALKAGLEDAIVGGALQGSLDLGGNAIKRGTEALIPVLDKAVNGFRDKAGNLIDENLTPVGKNQPQNGELTPTRDNLPATNDGNVSFEDRLNNSPLGQGSDIVLNLPEPPSPSQIASEWTPPSRAAENGASNLPSNAAAETAPVADGVAQTSDNLPTNMSPVEPRTMNVPETVTSVPVTSTKTTTAPAVADGTVLPSKVVPAVADTKMPSIKSEDVQKLQDARVGANQADEAAINQQLQQIDSSLPEGMTTTDATTSMDGAPLSREQIVERLMPKLADNTDVKQRIADAVGMSKDTQSPVREILSQGGVNPAQAERVATHFDNLQSQLAEYNRLEEANQKAYLSGGTEALNPEVSKQRSRVTRDMGVTTRRLMDEINNIEGSRDFKAKLVRGLTDMIGTRNASVLTSAGLIERNMAQELTANAKLALKNPIKMARSTFANGNILGDTAKAELSHWKDAPRNPLEALKYVVGNTYRTAMIPTTALANTRRGAVRDELTSWAYKELEGRNLSPAEAHKLAGTAGNEMEALVNTFIGVDNGMTSRGQATEALKAWKEYMRTGDDGTRAEFLKRVETHSSLADQMIAGLSKDNATRAKGLMAMKNLIFPFVRTATNLMKTTVKQDLNPFAKSLIDEIRADQRGGLSNAINTVKSKLVDYGIMGGAAALASSGVLAYNDGDQVDKPRGWSISIGNNQYIPVRSTSLELPLALAGTAQAMASDIASGKPRDWQYYAGMVTGSLPYIDQFNTTTGAVDSAMSGQDSGYAAKNYVVNMAKSFVPFNNNGIQPYVAGKQGQSLNAKSVYDDNLMTWLGNTIRKNYDPAFYNSLPDSRDNAGRVRTVENQGIITNKTINDANTARYNDVINKMVQYGRENGLGKNTQDMFNTYDTGKNNNFKSVQDTITFLDIPSGGKPNNADKLKQNGKLASLAQQMHDGFYGDTGNDLLTLDGKELKSDASVPSTAGTKNSKLPLSMQSIKNAVAQTDIGTAASDQLYKISQQKTDLYNQLKAKAISYDQYSSAKSQLEQAEVGILSTSENYKKFVGLMDNLNGNGFFDTGGMGSTKAGQTYLWNSINTLLGSKGATPAANYPDAGKAYTPWGRSSGQRASNKPSGMGNEGIKWTPVKQGQMAPVTALKYTPLDIKVKLGNAVKKDKTQNYSDRSF